MRLTNKPLCLNDFERWPVAVPQRTFCASLDCLPNLDNKVDMATRRQVANKLRPPDDKASKADKSKVLDQVLATNGMGRSTARRMLIGPRIADPAERVDGRRFAAIAFQRRCHGAAGAWVGVDGHAVRPVRGFMLGLQLPFPAEPVIWTGRLSPSRDWLSRRR